MKPEGEKGRKMKTFELLSRDYTLFLLVFFLLSLFFFSSFFYPPFSLPLSAFSVFRSYFLCFRGKKKNEVVSTVCLWLCFSFLLWNQLIRFKLATCNEYWKRKEKTRICISLGKIDHFRHFQKINRTTFQSIHLSYLNTGKKKE